ncbi:MAG: aminotransferase class V-fold PLP-dependent enzyme, partial [Lewinella sp.]|nr:aminotransferase class V-fold PLP-dependent enzyme [Lewinella sp.]
MPTLDLDFVRRQFPVFGTENGQDIAFFDNAGGSYVAGAVIDRLTAFYRDYKVQPYGPNPLARQAGEAMDLGRQTMADLLHVSTEELTLGPSSTQNLNTLAIACIPLLHERAEVIVTEQDHEANIGGWERICRLTGATLRFWRIDPATGELPLENLAAVLNERTAIVCMTHSSNIIGSLNPVNEAALLTRAVGARLVVDGVSFAPHEWPNLDELQADAYVFSTYKTYGTHLGAMVVRPDFLRELTPQCHFFNTPYHNKWLDAAGPDHAAIAALAGVGDYFTAVHDHHFAEHDRPLYEKARRVSTLMKAHENRICGQLLDGLRTLPVRIYGRDTMDGREANIALRAEGKSSAELTAQLAQQGIAAKNGHFYAYRL